jgi:hypothetical protein
MIPSPYFEAFPNLLGDIAVVIATAALPCAAMLGLAIIAIRREKVPIVGTMFGTPLLRISFFAVVLTITGFLIINAATHSLIRRQIFGIVPLVVAYLTAFALPHLRVRGLTFALIAANVVIASAGTALTLKSKRNFERFGAQMAEAQRGCPSLPIYAVRPEMIAGTPENPFPYIKDQVEIGYEWVGRSYGLRLRHDIPRDWIDPRCGAIVWSEFLWLRAPPTPQSIAGKLGLADRHRLGSATIQYVDRSMLMRVPAETKRAVR